MPYHPTKDARELINKGPLMIQCGSRFELLTITRKGSLSDGPTAMLIHLLNHCCHNLSLHILNPTIMLNHKEKYSYLCNESHYR